MSSNSEHINYFAETDYRGKKIKFGIKEGDRARHMYVIGKTGMGKSTLLENLAVQDIQNGEGMCFIDPHGSSAEMLLAYVPEHRKNDVVYFAPFDQAYPLALNVMEDIGADKRALVASGLIGAFKKVWVDAWSPRMEYILNNALLALLETPGSTLLGVNRMFSDKAYRDSIIENVKDPSVRAFWLDEYAKYSDKFATEATAAIQNKVGQFAANPLIRNIIGQPKSTFDIRKLMDEKKIFIVNLSKGRIGEGNANLVGSMLITKIYLAAMSRAEIHPTELHKLPAFYLYVDEFQSFANESFADILSEARKYKLALTIAHQYIEQMSEEVRAAVFGNVGTMISFRVGSYDAEVLEKEFAPQFTAQDIVNLGFAQVYLKLMINGVGSPPFSATTLPRPAIPEPNFVQAVVDASRSKFGRPRADIEEDIRVWHQPIASSRTEGNSFVPETKKIMPGERGTGERSAPRFPTRERQGERAAPVAKKPQEVHQPFAAAFSSPVPQKQDPIAVSFEAKKEGGENTRIQDRNDRPLSSYVSREAPGRGASLSTLKSQPKRDKGPTPENLSGLRAALNSVMSVPQQKAAETLKPKEGDVVVSVAIPGPANSPQKREPERVPQPYAQRSPQVSSGGTGGESVPEQTVQKLSEQHAPLSRPPLLHAKKDFDHLTLPEVPEEVLRRVLDG